jgi:hypothetical protein
MTIDQTINTVVGVATSAAAVFAWLTARAAKTQGKAALEQIDLLRPRPVIVLEGRWNLEADTGVPDAFLVQNVGSSPAFDIQITQIEGPVVRPHGYREHLVTNRIFAIAEKSEVRAVHHRLLPGNQIDDRAAFAFMNSAGLSFGATGDDPDSLRPALEFKVSYAALDGRRFVTPCRVRFWLGLKACAEIVPAASWLGENPA